MFGFLGFGSKPKKASSDGDPPAKRGFFGLGAPKPIPEKFTNAEIKKLNKHWAKNINKRDMLFHEFIALPDWGMNPLVPRVLEIVKPEVKDAPDLSTGPTLHLQDYINVYEKLRNLQTREQKLKFAFEMMDYDEDGAIGQKDLQTFFQMITGLSEDACLYHSRQFFDDREPPVLQLDFEAFKNELPTIDFFTKFDLPEIQ